MPNWEKIDLLYEYIKREWALLPIHWISNQRCSCGNRGCSSPGKHPLVKGGFRSATLDPEQIRQWHKNWPEANWGLRTGAIEQGGSGLVVVDIDPKNHGFETWENLVMEHPDREDTVSVRSGNGGTHLWFQYPADATIPCSAGVLGPGVDIRGDGGYIIVPPSRTTGIYRFEHKPSEFPLLDLPGWLQEALDRPGSKLALEDEGLDLIPQGHRHQALVLSATRWRGNGMNCHEITAALKAQRNTRFEPGDHSVSDEEIEAIARWACELPKTFRLTDLGNGRRFVDQHAPEVRYCYGNKSWLVWDSRVWQQNAEDGVKRRAHATVERIRVEAAQLEDEDARQRLLKHAHTSESSLRIENMLRCAQPYLATTLDTLDQHPHLLNAGNGIVDLRTGELLPHNPSLMLTKLVDVPYIPSATCPQWMDFLQMIAGGDPALVGFLQVMVGYSLSGFIDEHVMFILYGTGNNGKTTFLESIKSIMGPYAVKVPVDTLLLKKWGSGPTPNIVRMAGTRLVQTSEVSEEGQLNEPLVKELTGGDKIIGRGMYSDPIEFTPTHKVWMAGNYKPRIKGNDPGIKRRLVVVPFRHKIPARKRKRMSRVQSMFAAEREGILAWGIAGAMRWFAGGLGTPQTVTEATKTYRSDQDIVQQFLDECCESGPEFKAGKSPTYAAWQSWLRENGEADYLKKSKNWLTYRLRNLGFKTGGRGNQSYCGLKLVR